MLQLAPVYPNIKKKLLTQCFVPYVGRTFSGKKNTQCITYLKDKNKTNEHVLARCLISYILMLIDQESNFAWVS